MTANCLREGLEILRVYPPRSQECFDRTSGAPLGAWAVPNAGFLNDVAVGADGTVYVTDTGIAITAQGFAPTGTAAIYRFDAGGEARAIAQGDALTLPNGIIDTPQGLVMVPVGGNTVVGVAPDGELTVVAELPQGQLDGVVALEDGSLVVSSFGANAIYHVSSSGAVTEIISDTPAADIGFDAGRSSVLIPQLDRNTSENRKASGASGATPHDRNPTTLFRKENGCPTCLRLNPYVPSRQPHDTTASSGPDKSLA